MPKFTGIVLFINPPKVNSEKSTTQEICLDTSVEINGTEYPSFVSIQASNNQLAKLDNVKVGDKVEITASINGYVFTKKEDPVRSERNPDGLSCITNIRFTSIKMLNEDGSVKETPVSTNAAPAQSAQKADDDYFKE